MTVWLQVAKKHKTATGVKWRVPGMMGGNAVPGWEDQQGSIVRRIVLFLFLKAVENVDTSIPMKLTVELPALLVKCNRAYLEAVEEVGQRSIWQRGILPSYFHSTREEMAQIVNSMRGFMATEVCHIGDHLYCPERELQKAFYDYIKDHNITPRPVWRPDLYKGPLESKGLRIQTCVREYPRGSGNRCRLKFVLGIDVVGDDEGDEENQCPNAN